MKRHGWNILFDPCRVLQLQKLKTAAERGELAAPSGFAANAKIIVFACMVKIK